MFWIRVTMSVSTDLEQCFYWTNQQNKARLTERVSQLIVEGFRALGMVEGSSQKEKELVDTDNSVVVKRVEVRVQGDRWKWGKYNNKWTVFSKSRENDILIQSTSRLFCTVGILWKMTWIMHFRMLICLLFVICSKKISPLLYLFHGDNINESISPH